jgi:hypothetical protein
MTAKALRFQSGRDELLIKSKPIVGSWRLGVSGLASEQQHRHARDDRAYASEMAMAIPLFSVSAGGEAVAGSGDGGLVGSQREQAIVAAPRARIWR